MKWHFISLIRKLCSYWRRTFAAVAHICADIAGRSYEKVIFSLALGTFGLGMAEFGIMGVLTELARDVGISIPAAGHMISFYAFGVVLECADYCDLFQPLFAETYSAVSGHVVCNR